MKIGELLNSSQALGRLAAQPINTVLAFRLKRIIKQVNSELQTFEESRKELCEKHGTLREDKSQYDFKTEESLEAFQKDFNSLLNEEVDIRFDHFTEESLAGVELATNDLFALEWLFTEEPKLKAVEAA